MIAAHTNTCGVVPNMDDHITGIGAAVDVDGHRLVTGIDIFYQLDDG